MVKISQDEFENNYELLNIEANMEEKEYYIEIETGKIVSKTHLRIIGAINKNIGYIQCSLSKLKKTFYAHALVFLHVNNISKYDTNLFEIDHIDRNPLNNSSDNLRLVSISKNRLNRKFKVKTNKKKNIKKQIKAFNIDENSFKIYDNIKQITDALNISGSIISMILSKRKYYKKSYSDVYENDFTFSYL